MRSLLIKPQNLRLLANRSISKLSESNEADLLVKSVVPTDYFLPNLFSLPLPKLADTLEKYSQSQQAFLSDENFRKTKSLIDSFGSNEGMELDKLFRQFARDNSHTNYVNIFWTDRYLCDRSPVVLTHTPCMILTNPNASENDQLTRSVNMLWSSIRYMRSFKMNLLEPIIFHMNPQKSDTDQYRKMLNRLPKKLGFFYSYFKKAFPLDISQLYGMFNSTRIPQIGKDRIAKFQNERHILVLHKGQMYTFDIFDQNNRGVSPQQLASNIQFILSQPPSEAGHNSPGLGVFTTMNRDEWALARDHLLKLGNEQVLRKVDSAAFVLILDTPTNENDTEKFFNNLHGGAENRWFDKSMSLMIDGKGDAGITLEHSWGDGLAVTFFIDGIHNDSSKNPAFSHKITETDLEKCPAANVERIQFILDDYITKDVLEKARQEYNDKRDKVSVNFAQFDEMGKKKIAKSGISKDALMQLSFQMAYSKIHKTLPSVYESASTAIFKDGRTETVRPLTVETKRFMELYEKDPENYSELIPALISCDKLHKTLTKAAATGKGWDRHLMGLRKMSERNNIPSDLFKDPNYDRINSINLSTSSVPTEALYLGGFAPVINEGYGIGYGAKDNAVGCVMTTWNDSSFSNGSQCADALIDSLRSLSKILDHKMKSDKQ